MIDWSTAAGSCSGSGRQQADCLLRWRDLIKQTSGQRTIFAGETLSLSLSLCWLHPNEPIVHAPREKVGSRSLRMESRLVAGALSC